MANYESLMDAAKQALAEQVAPRMQEILLSHIDSDVYGAQPESPRYKRRGSLRKADNFITKVTPDGSDGLTVFVTSVAEPAPPATGWSADGDGAFLYMLEVGNLGWYRRDFPRPAITNAQKEIDNDRQISAMLKRLGFTRR